MGEYDSPWKEALDRFFPWFVELFLPHVHADIDWSRKYESLDKELAKIVREAKAVGRVADKLFKVWLKTGQSVWVLIHIEVQAQKEADEAFALRMYTYHYRIFDRYSRPVATIVVLADDNPKWRPVGFTQELWDTRIEMRFKSIKLLDYRRRVAELERSRNPFGLIVAAHLRNMEIKTDTGRKAAKVRLVKNLLDRGLSADDIRQLFRVIDWIIDLPEDLTKSFWEEIEAYEEEKKVPHLTSTERLWMKQGIEKGIEQGIQEGLAEGIVYGLEQKFGKEGKKLAKQVKELHDLQKLRALSKALWQAESIAEIQAVLEEGSGR